MKRSFERGRLSAPGSIPLLAMDSRENMPLVGRTRPWTLICALTRDVGGPDTPARGWKADAGHTTQMTRTPATNGAVRAPLVTISVQPEELPLKCKRVYVWRLSSRGKHAGKSCSSARAGWCSRCRTRCVVRTCGSTSGACIPGAALRSCGSWTARGAPGRAGDCGAASGWSEGGGVAPAGRCRPGSEPAADSPATYGHPARVWPCVESGGDPERVWTDETCS
jgi:hypothetical protein